MTLRKIIRKILPVFCLLTGVMEIQGTGLPGEFLLTQRWRDMIAQYSPLNNPAFLTEENYLSARLAFAPILNGEFKHGEVGLTIPIGLYQSAGVTFLFSPEGTVQEGIVSGDNLIPAKGGKSNSNYLIIASYAWHFWNRLSAGLNLSTAIQTAFGDPVWGVGMDLGLTYRLIRDPILGDHLLGLSTQNLIAPQMKGETDEAGAGSFSRDMKFSWLGRYWESRLESAVDFDLKDFWAAAAEFKDGASGTSVAKKLEWDLNVKLGAWVLRLLKMYLQFGFDEDALDYWGMAFGVNAPSVNNGRDLEVLYQYNVMTEKDNDATGHTIYARVAFGKHREEVYARRLARLASLSPNELYNRARKLYSEKKYWDAFFIFSRIIVEFPDFFKNDWVEYYRASCQEELDMRNMAIQNYDKMKDQYTKSSAVPYADLGMMRVYYRNGEYGRVSNQFVELSKPDVPDSLRFHGAYIMGQSYLQINEYGKAIQALSMVPDSHPDYVYAQHALAVVRARLDDQNTSDIVTALENCISTKPVTEGQKEMINRSYLFLGYIFYEENTLSKAVVALRMVPQSSYYFEDALLGQCWTALKARQWNDCITLGQMLRKSSSKTVIQCEGLLIQAYGHLLQKQYDQARTLLMEASEKIKSAVAPDNDTLNYQRMQYESNRLSHSFLAEKVEKLSLSGINSSMSAQNDSLHTAQKDYMKKFDDYFHFTNEHYRSLFFSRNIMKVSEDIEYALATVQKIAGTQADSEKIIQQMQGQQEQIDKEIERLKKEMEELQKKAD
ncbi:MAG: tetratricopeptide repeat protein [Fibrobacter sp.]|jgi:tetratricopeptide (TPR) repeat protein|nr:tetratricopeptide repeat protein [Fibrobacter sp.]